ncbi:MAG TPA: DUF481 domain-containing protein [Chitinophagaceae bacterium]
MRFIIISILLFTSTLAQSQEAKDTIFFTNGSIVIGEIKSIKLGVVSFDPDDANDITVQLRKLKTIAGRKMIYRVETVDHRLYFGILLPDTVSNTVRIKTESEIATIDIENISILYPFEKSIKQRFSGSVGIGYTYTRSSGFGRLNFDGSIKYLSRKTESSLSTSGIYTMYDTLLSRDQENIYLKINYYFVRNWFLTAFIAYQRNLELGLQRRYQQGLGIGNKFLTRKNIYAWGRGGLVINQEKSTEDVSSGTLTELFGQIEVNVFSFDKPNIDILLSQSFFYSLSQAGRFRNDGNLSVNWELFKDFDISLEPYNNYDSKPPVEGSHKFDFGIVVGINYKF